jgi:hypothetical protein
MQWSSCVLADDASMGATGHTIPDLIYAGPMLLPPACRCSLTGRIFTDPVNAADGHTYGKQHPACAGASMHTHLLKACIRFDLLMLAVYCFCTAERSALERHLATGSLTSPSTRQKMPSALVFPNFTLKVGEGGKWWW